MVNTKKQLQIARNIVVRIVSYIKVLHDGVEAYIGGSNKENILV